jgi:hypothetical protein
MALISRNTYRPGQIAALGMQREHVRIVSRLAGACRIWRAFSDRSKAVSVMADAVEETIG